MRGNRQLILCLSLVVGLVNHSAGRETQKLVCTVRVVDVAARPVPGAEVVAYKYTWDLSVGRVRMEILQQAKTDADGTAVLNLETSTPRDTYFLVARKQGLALGWVRLKPEITIVLEKPLPLAGTVVDEANEPIAGAQVRVFPRHSWLTGLMNAVVGAPDDWFTTKTDAEGRFGFNNIPADVTSDLLVEAAGRGAVYTSPAWDGLLGWRFAAGRTDIRVALPREARIQGRVVDPNGNGVAGIRLLARPINRLGGSYCPDTIVSQEDGAFCFRGLPAEAYLVQVVTAEEGTSDWVGKETKVTTKPGQTTDGVTVELGKGGVVEVVVREPATDEVISGARVHVRKSSRFGADLGVTTFSKSTRTDSKGVARVRTPLGQCRISVGKGGYALAWVSHIVEEGTSEVDLSLEREPGISGTAHDQNGEPVAGAIVDALPLSSGAVQTDSTGRFDIFWLWASRAPRWFVLARHTKRDLAALVEMEEQPGPLKIELAPALTLAGRITDPEGAPIPAAGVNLKAELPGRQLYTVAQVTTDAQGHYEITALPLEQEGFTYFNIEVAASGYGPFLLERPSLADPINNRVELRAIVLPPANLSVSGIVVDVNDGPVAGARVYLSGPRGSKLGQRCGHILTDADGAFSFDRICAGPLRLQASAEVGEPGFLNAQGGDHGVKIVMGQRLVHERKVSLVGRPLPNLTGFGLTAALQAVAGKRVLVCFWDMNQRPSRNCLRQLSTRAQELQAQDVIVVAVQAANIDKDTLNEWVKTNNIPFPTGMVHGDEEEIRFAWGVKS
ncbi:MAG: carboxypeptidase regulatory-like domain-containing protein, partial [Phycisphaerales bacterium]